MYLLAVLSAVGGLILLLALCLHTVKICGPNPYDVTLTLCTGSTHPWVAAGIGAGVGGAVQSALFTVVGRLCGVVDRLRPLND